MMTVAEIKNLPYVTRLQVPLRWQGQAEALDIAVMAYLDHRINESRPEPTQEQLRLMVGYLSYYIQAPCWDQAGVEALRVEIEQIEAGERIEAGDVARWIHGCLVLAIDPL